MNNTFTFLPHPPHRITLVTPGWTESGQAAPVSHGLDYDTAKRLLAELVLALFTVRPTPQSLEQNQPHSKFTPTPME